MTATERELLLLVAEMLLREQPSPSNGRQQLHRAIEQLKQESANARSPD